MKSVAIFVQMMYFSRHLCKKVCKGCSVVLGCSDVLGCSSGRLCSGRGLCLLHKLLSVEWAQPTGAEGSPQVSCLPVLKVAFCALGTLARSEGRLHLAFSLYCKLLFVPVIFHAWAHFLELSAQIAFQSLQWLNFCVCARLMQLMFFTKFHSVCTGTFTSCSF